MSPVREHIMSLTIAGHPFSVSIEHNPNEELGRHGRHGSIGLANVQTGQIVLRGGGENQPHNLRDTLLHEVTHVVLSLSVLDGEGDVFKTERMGERLVEVLGTHLLDTLRRNPQLVEYLMEADNA